MLNITRNRGYAVVALETPDNVVNIGHALRASGAMDGNMVVVEKTKYPGMSIDTSKSYKHVPLLEVDNMLEVVPYECTKVGVELIEDATPIHEYKHPERAFYIFGPEESSVSEHLLKECDEIISIPSNYCLNLGCSVYVVLYDRLAKRLINEDVRQNRKQIFKLS